jgi:hypothetical protein
MKVTVLKNPERTTIGGLPNSTAADIVFFMFPEKDKVYQKLAQIAGNRVRYVDAVGGAETSVYSCEPGQEVIQVRVREIIVEEV